MTSDNVIHDFWVPELAGKKDVVPGEIHTEVIQAVHPVPISGSAPSTAA